MCSLASSQSNPLDTPDQRTLGSLAIKLHQLHPYDDLISDARQQFASVAEQHGYDVKSPAMLQSLDTAVKELAFSSMQKAINDDPAHPMVYWLINPPRGSVLGGRYAYDNPDAIYRTIPVSGSYNYVIRGKRAAGGLADASFSLITNLTVTTAITVLANEDLVLDSDGSFVITINSTASSSPNHIQSDSRAVQLFVRNNIADWDSQRPDSLEVEIVSTGSLPDSISEDEIIDKARDYFKQSIPAYGTFLLGDQTLSRPQNIINAPVQSSSFGTLATQASSFSHYNLSKEDALVITIDAGPATCWVLPSYTLWTITDRPGERLESLNMDQAVANSNGTYTAVLSRIDPGVYNWINATVDGVGTFMCRFQGLPLGDNGGSQVQVWSQVVPMKRLNHILPKGTKRVGKKERGAQLRERAEGYGKLRSF
ncbi:hypothetical protein B0J15DRAFT_515585 [Fusarium solani]|uniref:DUF1214 domain-containing protein n=2 Tax=Fusarium solani TaxID=169388 RepID=A0A9P9GSN0_FUSSL|nr:uncharacterized protein B0J15DRAFT_515585 [Fusarium solani]KAH7243980.1 hypothetical protein B0J15DRAFT_515585 [Fusarium solani]